jgi:hypothetical protein
MSPVATHLWRPADRTVLYQQPPSVATRRAFRRGRASDRHRPTNSRGRRSSRVYDARCVCMIYQMLVGARWRKVTPDANCTVATRRGLFIKVRPLKW